MSTLDNLTRKTILERALSLTMGDRNQTHGDPVLQHSHAAQLWSAYTGQVFTPTDVAIMMSLVKISRSRHGRSNPDDFIDAAGYLAIAGECAHVG